VAAKDIHRLGGRGVREAHGSLTERMKKKKKGEGKELKIGGGKRQTTTGEENRFIANN